MPQLIPLTQFVCDKCGKLIEKPSDGYVEWLTIYTPNEPVTVSEFKIIHAQVTSPNKAHKEGCHHHLNSDHLSDIDLSHFLKNAHQYIYAFLSPGPLHDIEGNEPSQVVDFAAFTDFARRLTIPYYEEARQYFDKAINDGYFSDHHSIAIFTEETLLHIIEDYGENYLK